MVRIVDRKLQGFTGGIFRELKKSRSAGRIDQKLAPLFAQELKEFAIAVIGDLPATSSLKMRTGRLIAQLIKGVKVTGGGSADSIRLTIDAPQEIAVHEFGATIRAKSAQYLAIPVLYGLRPDGSPKFKGPRSYTRYKPFVFKSKDGRKFLAYRTKTGGLRVIYRLIEEVTIRKRLRLNQAIDRRSGEFMTGFGKLIVQELKRTNWYEELKAGAGGNERAVYAIRASFSRGFKKGG